MSLRESLDEATIGDIPQVRRAIAAGGDNLFTVT